MSIFISTALHHGQIKRFKCKNLKIENKKLHNAECMNIHCIKIYREKMSDSSIYSCQSQPRSKIRYAKKKNTSLF